jgi:hypothetical protein
MPLNTPGGSSDGLGSSHKSKTYPNATGDINVAGDGGGVCRRIRVGGAGAIVIDYGGNVTDTIPGLLAGETLDVQAYRILANGTTATNITVFW